MIIKKKLKILVSVILIIDLIMFTINNFNKNTEDSEINVVLGSEPNSLDPAIKILR